MKYNNLKDVFFDSKYHVGKGLATYDKSLDPVVFDQLATMDAVAASQVAMDAVAASQVAMDAVAASQVAMDAVAASQVAMDAVAASQVAMDAVAASQVAMDAVAASQVAMDAIFDSWLAKEAIWNSDIAVDAVLNHQFSFNWLLANKAITYTRNNTSDSVGTFYTVTNKKVLVLQAKHNVSSSSYYIKLKTMKDGSTWEQADKVSAEYQDVKEAAQPLEIARFGSVSSANYYGEVIYVLMEE